MYGQTFIPQTLQKQRIRSKFNFGGILAYTGGLIDMVFHNIRLVAIGCAVLALPFVVQEIRSYTENFTGPLSLESLPAQELEILNKAMTEFALDRSSEFDADGNVLNTDGTALKPSEVSFQQPVSYRSYTVSSGDTLTGITRRFGLTNISTLIAVNDIDNVRQLRAGQKLRVPSIDGLLYTVRRGDTLTGLSVKYHVSVEDLLDVNDLSSHILASGRTLFIPGAKLSSEAIRRAMGEVFM